MDAYEGDWREFPPIHAYREVFLQQAPAAEPVPFVAEEPQPLMREVPNAAAYPVEALGLLRPMAVAVQGVTQAPIAIPAASVLAVASLAVQGHANVETLGGSRPLSLFILTIAVSGERKSSSDALVMAALREFEQDQARAHRDEMAAWQNSHAVWKAARETVLGDIRKSKGEKRVAARADLEAIGRETVAPRSTDRTVSEPTFEGLTQLFATGQPSLGLFSDEGGQFLGGFAMSRDNRQKTMTAFNDLWQGNPIRRTRAGDGHVTLRGRRLAMHLMIQPDLARGFLVDPLASGSGFTARYLLSEPPSKIGTRLHANVRHDPAPIEAFRVQLRAILEAPMPIDAETGELQPREVALSYSARARLVSYSDQVEMAQAPGGRFAHVTAAASKAAEQAARIAGVLTLWRDLGAAEVTDQDMADGIELADYYLSEAARLADAAAVSPELGRAETLRRWLLEKWQHPDILLSDVIQRAPVTSLRNAPAAGAALAILEAHGWLVAHEPGAMIRDKPRRKAWRIVQSGKA